MTNSKLPISTCLLLGIFSSSRVYPTYYFPVRANPIISVNPNITHLLVVMTIAIHTPIYMSIPQIKIGFLPTISPNLVSVTHPITIPTRKKLPINPISKFWEHCKSKWRIKLYKVSVSVQSSLYWAEGF